MYCTLIVLDPSLLPFIDVIHDGASDDQYPFFDSFRHYKLIQINLEVVKKLLWCFDLT